MNRDDYMEGLKSHYIEEINESLVESEINHGEDINYILLNQLVYLSWYSAKIEGVPLELFIIWISDAIPELTDYIDLINLKQAA